MTTVIGEIRDARGRPVTGALTFRLSGLVSELGEDVFVAPVEATTGLQPDGSFTIGLWPNTAGLSATKYSVTLAGNGLTAATLQIPDIVIPESDDPIELSILTNGAWIVPGKKYVQLTQSAYDALPAKAADTIYIVVEG
ncbi:hypothetical protein CDV52_18310 [Haematobacter missouriensis]|uniref:Minor tail protein gp31 C-terminal domain-containing protein n=1 Tax=Haematobacter missouriensis TaxID=366616 RepID=A0A212AIR3_9RHOB|nr:hypothetical protein CDV52_18310 [Haematobacter missouriensis]